MVESSGLSSRSALWLGIVAAALLAPLWALAYRDESRLEDLRDHGVVVTGQVVEKRCDNHGEVFYRYDAAGRRLGGQGFDTNCDALSQGSPIQVTYSRLTPANSAGGDMSKLCAGSTGSYVFPSILSVFALLAILRAWSDRPYPAKA
jgi:hypothetical protein